MKRLKLAVNQIICILLILCLSGCWNSRELDMLGIVLGIGIDLPEKEPGKVEITAQLVMPGEIGSPGKGGGGNGEAFWNVSSTGETVFGAVREMTSKSSRKLFFPHNEVLIFGYSAAEDGIQKYLDFFERDHETRNKVVIIISETSAEDILNVKSKQEKIPAVNILDLVNQYADATSRSMAVKLSDIYDNFMSSTTSAVAPIVKVTKDGDEELVEITGTAVFKSDKIVGRLDGEESRGLLWVLGEVKSGVIDARDSEGCLVSVEIIRSKVKVKPVLEDGKILIKIDVFEEGNISEESGSENLAELSEVAYLEERIGEAIQNEIIAAIEKAWELDADIFGFGDMINARYPKQWEEMEDSWDDLFRELEIELTVDAKLRLMGKISKPLVPEKG